VLDNGLKIWRAYKNEYWPAHYFIDAQGRIRHHHFGEGDYDQSEKVIQQLLAEAGRSNVPGGVVVPRAGGAQAAADVTTLQSPETYVGYGRGDNFASGPVVYDQPATYVAPRSLPLNQWGLGGRWTIAEDKSRAERAGARIVFRFHARDLHLVLGPGSSGKPVHFRVTLDGLAPGAAHGMDSDSQGYGTVTGQRLYQLIRQPGPVSDKTFAIEFLDPGGEAFAFTFG